MYPLPAGAGAVLVGCSKTDLELPCPTGGDGVCTHQINEVISDNDHKPE